MKKYKMIQISDEHHSILKEYCDVNDKKMSKVIERIIDTHFTIKKLKSEPSINEKTPSDKQRGFRIN
jgi:hypothetical protein